MSANIDVLSLLAAAFAGLIALALWRMIESLGIRVEVYSDPRTRLAVADLGDTALAIRGGELEADFYAEFLARLEAAGVKDLQIIFGPSVVVSKSGRDIFNRVPDGTQPATLDWLAFHPVLAYFQKYPDRVKLYLKRKTVAHERHFSIGNDRGKKNLCIEDEHLPGNPGGGRLVSGDKYLYDKWLQRFEQSRDDREYCTEFTLENANKLRSEITIECKED